MFYNHLIEYKPIKISIMMNQHPLPVHEEAARCLLCEDASCTNYDVAYYTSYVKHHVNIPVIPKMTLQVGTIE